MTRDSKIYTTISISRKLKERLLKEKGRDFDERILNYAKKAGNEE